METVDAKEKSIINSEILQQLEGLLQEIERSTKRGSYYYDAKYDGVQNGIKVIEADPNISLEDLNNKRRMLGSKEQRPQYEVGFDDGMREVVRTVRSIRESHGLEEEIEIM
jgi:hypothetical protein